MQYFATRYDITLLSNPDFSCVIVFAFAVTHLRLVRRVLWLL